MDRSLEGLDFIPRYLGRVRARFGLVSDAGFQPVPDMLLFHQAELGVSSEELNVLLNVLAHWYDPERVPYPRVTSIAKRMGVSERSVQRALASLRKKGLVNVVKKASPTGTPGYDVTPLVDRLRPLAVRWLLERGKLSDPERLSPFVDLD